MKNLLTSLCLLISMAFWAQNAPNAKDKNLDEIDLNGMSLQAIKQYRETLKINFKSFKKAQFKATLIVKSDTLIYSGSIENKLADYKISYQNYHEKEGKTFDKILKSYLRAIHNQRMAISNHWLYSSFYCRKMDNNSYLFSPIKKSIKNKYDIQSKAFDVGVSLDSDGQMQSLSSHAYNNLDEKNSNDLYAAKQKSVVHMATKNGQTRFLSSIGWATGLEEKKINVSISFD